MLRPLEPVDHLVHRRDTAGEEGCAHVRDDFAHGFAAGALLVVAEALLQHEPPDVDVARLDQAKSNRGDADPAVDLRDRNRAIVELLDERQKTRVVARSERNQGLMVADAATAEGAEFATKLASKTR